MVVVVVEGMREMRESCHLQEYVCMYVCMYVCVCMYVLLYQVSLKC